MGKEKIVGGIDHVVIGVKSIEKAKEFFCDLLDTEFIEIGVNEEAGYRSVMSPGGLELLEPTRPDSDLARFLDERGEGLCGLAFTVQDAGKARAKAEKKGIRVVRDLRNKREVWQRLEGLREICLHPKDSFGVYLMFTEGNPYHP